MRNKQYYVYITSNPWRTVFYIGVSNNLSLRLDQHQNRLFKSFTKQYNVTELIYYEIYNDVNEAIAREKQLKKWSRKKKLWLIKRTNPLLKTIQPE